MGREVLRTVDAKTPLPKISDSFYSCLDCHACLYVCPAGVNAGKVSLLSREVITSLGDRKTENAYARMIARTTAKLMNPLGKRKRSALWAKGIQFDRKADNLLYTGNMFQLMPYTRSLNKVRKLMGNKLSIFVAGLVARFPRLITVGSRTGDPKIESRMNETLRNITYLLKLSGVTFDYLGPEEPYPGTFLYDLGYMTEFSEYAKRVYAVLKATGKKRIITVDPHTYDLLKNTYPDIIPGFDLEVVHYLDFLKDIQVESITKKVVFHEPCHFTMREPKYQAPLDILRRTGEVLLPARNGSRTRCCGGPDELTFPEIAERASEIRYKELTETGADLVVTACPICFVNLSKGDNTMEIADFLASRMRLTEKS